jgi:hypothetical protein
MNGIDKNEAKQRILNFTIQGVEKFLNDHSGLTFYAFAYDCNAEYAEVSLCFNTESDFEKTLAHYKSGDYAEFYESADQIRELKYNTGDWEYQCFETMHLMGAAELEAIFAQLPEEEHKSWGAFIEDLMKLFCETMLDFSKSETYTRIPKTKDFVAFCLDHDEDVNTAFRRMEKV